MVREVLVAVRGSRMRHEKDFKEREKSAPIECEKRKNSEAISTIAAKVRRFQDQSQHLDLADKTDSSPNTKLVSS